MFEEKIQKILEKRANTEKMLIELNKIYGEYEKNDRTNDNLFWVNTRIPVIKEADRYAKKSLVQILQGHELPNPFNDGYCNTKNTVNEMVEYIKNITIKDFYKTITRWNYYNNQNFNNNEYTDTRVYPESLIKILNCLWLENHPEPMDNELTNKIYKKATAGETFIFLNNKVTRYKNGNLKIKFGDLKLFEQFKNNFNEAKLYYEEKNKKEVTA